MVNVHCKSNKQNLEMYINCLKYFCLFTSCQLSMPSIMADDILFIYFFFIFPKKLVLKFHAICIKCQS